MSPPSLSQPPQLIICDIDGCLAPETSEPFDLDKLRLVAEHNRRALATGAVPPLTVCTGRPEPFAEAVCRLIGNARVPCVAENGAWLYFPSTNEYSRDPSIEVEHVEMVHHASVELLRCFGPMGVSQQPGKAASVTLYHPQAEYLQKVLPEVQELVRSHGWPFRVTMTWLYINCDLEHVSKGTGIARLLEKIGVPHDRTLGIGDTVSDLPMVDKVGVFACPANATDEIKSRAAYVSPFEQIDGVLDILRVFANKG